MTSNNRSKANFDVNSFGGRYWCDDCKKFVTNNKTSRKNHETNIFHLENRKKRIEAMNKTHSEQRAEADIARKEFLRISASADKAYEKDLKGIMNPYGADGKPIKVIPSKPLHVDPQLEPMPQELIDKQREKFAKRERARDIREGITREEEPVIVKEVIPTIPAAFKPPSQLLPKQEDDIIGIAGEWQEVKDYVESGYYSNYYKPTGSNTEPQTSQLYSSSYVESENGIKTEPTRIQINFSNNTKINSKEKEEIEEDDGFGCLSDAVIQNISHEKEARPDCYQVSKLNRLNNDNLEEGVTFKKRKLNKGGRKTTTTQKQDL
jgi:hypothetical protein